MTTTVTGEGERDDRCSALLEGRGRSVSWRITVANFRRAGAGRDGPRADLDATP